MTRLYHYLVCVERQEIPVDSADPLRNYESKFAVCAKAVHASTIRTDRRNPKRVEAALYELRIADGKLERTNNGTYAVMPVHKTLTRDEFETELDIIASSLPHEFAMFVRNLVKAQTHDYDKLLTVADSVTNDLCLAFERYESRMGRGK